MSKTSREMAALLTCCGVLSFALATGTWVGVVDMMAEAEAQEAEWARQQEAQEAEWKRQQEALAEADTQIAKLKREIDSLEQSRNEAAGWDNPISAYCTQIDARSTRDMATAAAFSREAWKRELDHLVAVIKESWEYRRGINLDVSEEWLAEHESRLDQYREAVDEEADAMANMIFDEWEAGWWGSAATIALASSEAEIYRSATVRLLDSFAGPHEWEKVYDYHFDETVVNELREYFGDPVNVVGIQMFPPISEMMGGDGP